MNCKQKDCDQAAVYRYTWPGRDESFVCDACAHGLGSVARAMGLYLQLVELDDTSPITFSETGALARVEADGEPTALLCHVDMRAEFIERFNGAYGSAPGLGADAIAHLVYFAEMTSDDWANPEHPNARPL